MTAVAALVAEALEHAEEETPDDRDDKPRFAVWSPGSVPYHVTKADLLDLDPDGEAVVVRDDVVLAVARHLAERCAKAEAERDGFQDALVMARVQMARAVGSAEGAVDVARRASASAETQALLADACDTNDKLRAQLKAAEERAGRAEARADKLRKSLDDVMYAICENALRGEGESAGAVCKRAIEDAAKEAGRG